MSQKTMQKQERRYFPCAPGTELRVDKREDGTKVLTGHAAVFNSRSEDLGGFIEIVKRGAFRESLNRGDDVRALVDHNPSKILGRRSAKTLKVREDRVGLAVEIDLPDTQAGRDIAVSVERGDVTGMSFAFRTIEDIFRTEEGIDIRELRQVDLIDVSPVTYPAYPETDVALRSLEAWRESEKRAQAQQDEDDGSAARELMEMELQLAEAE